MMKQKSKIIFVIIAVLGIIGIIFISGCVQPGSKLPSKEQQLARCEEHELQIRIDGCYNSAARMYKDPAICDKIIDLETKYRCYKELGAMLKDITICNKIGEGDEWGFKSLCEMFVEK